MLEALRAVEEHGNVNAAARAMGVPFETLRNRYKKAQQAGLHLSGGARNAMQASNLNGAEIAGGYRHVYDDEGKKVETVRWNAPKEQIALESTLERLQNAFSDIPRAEPITPPASVLGDLCTVWPVMDLHLGMRAWGDETGSQDYDLSLACEDLRYAFAKVLALTPASKEAVLVLGGDTLHADDDRAETPQSKHKLDVDGRQFKVIDTAIAILSEIIETLLAKHEKLTVRVLRGNHDTNAHMVLTFALAERYQDEPRIVVEKSPRDLFMKQWGRSAIFAHHGDKGKPTQMALYISDVCTFWSETRHRYYLTGHVHHDNAKDIGPLRYESLRAFCPPDSYAAGMGYGARRALQALTFHNHDGLVLRAIDPIERRIAA
ncbi:hypothetical protein [Aerobium aerolatum]|uniref:Uncharacterized protein n=1 Tax=Aquamicrobium aerolatum DSM 21857 TaxID=1121003 RepID=A0A1I3L8R4_9HYPH|nr:hypothetical protein [Aquamicrobium aerolatum]SFI81097.1 hypothetical protein SAMN03080618_01427 [Aquamicrobium aerolatum DSM 21857]